MSLELKQFPLLLYRRQASTQSWQQEYSVGEGFGCAWWKPKQPLLHWDVLSVNLIHNQFQIARSNSDVSAAWHFHTIAFSWSQSGGHTTNLTIEVGIRETCQPHWLPELKFPWIPRIRPFICSVTTFMWLWQISCTLRSGGETGRRICSTTSSKDHVTGPNSNISTTSQFHAIPLGGWTSIGDDAHFSIQSFHAETRQQYTLTHSVVVWGWLLL